MSQRPSTCFAPCFSGAAHFDSIEIILDHQPAGTPLSTAFAANLTPAAVTVLLATDYTWNVTGNADWRVADGVIEATKARGFLLTKESYTDFELRADVWTTPDSNGGVLFRITKPDDPGIENGYELNVNDKRADQTGRTGSIVNVAKPLVQFDAGGKWVTVDIIAKGPHMVATLNGIKTAEADDAKYNSGPVSLQAAGGIVRYRNVQIRPLK